MSNIDSETAEIWIKRDFKVWAWAYFIMTIWNITVKQFVKDIVFQDA